MTFTVRLRGAPPALIARDFLCPEHGMFDELVGGDDDVHACPVLFCGVLAERVISAVLFKPQRGAVRTGKSDPPPGPLALETSKLADGMKLREFKAERKQMWDARRRAEFKAKGLG